MANQTSSVYLYQMFSAGRIYQAQQNRTLIQYFKHALDLSLNLPVSRNLYSQSYWNLL